MSFIETLQWKTERFAQITEAISSLDMGVPFRIIPGKNAIEVAEVSVPDTVPVLNRGYLDGEDLNLPSEWTALRGYSGQYDYTGPIMHPSEVVSVFMVEDMCYIAEERPGVVFAVVPVALEEEPGDYIGWAVIFRTT